MIYFFDITMFSKKIFFRKKYDCSTYLKEFYVFNYIINIMFNSFVFNVVLKI